MSDFGTPPGPGHPDLPPDKGEKEDVVPKSELRRLAEEIDEIPFISKKMLVLLVALVEGLYLVGTAILDTC